SDMTERQNRTELRGKGVSEMCERVQRMVMDGNHSCDDDLSVRNINNLRYKDDTTLMAESKEELKA
ncbi:unnamed protein product, partial [Rangifer tarandus platyrhynchus]